MHSLLPLLIAASVSPRDSAVDALNAINLRLEIAFDPTNQGLLYLGGFNLAPNCAVPTLTPGSSTSTSAAYMLAQCFFTTQTPLILINGFDPSTTPWEITRITSADGDRTWSFRVRQKYGAIFVKGSEYVFSVHPLGLYSVSGQFVDPNLIAASENSELVPPELILAVEADIGYSAHLLNREFDPGRMAVVSEFVDADTGWHYVYDETSLAIIASFRRTGQSPNVLV